MSPGKDLTWLVYQFSKGEYMPLSKTFKTKAAGDKARLKYPKKESRTIG
jgi:hypothetical protein